MKKLLALLLCLLMLAAFAVTASAAGMTLTATASKTTVYLDDELVISVSVSGSDAYTSLGFIIEYDTGVFEYKSRSWGEATDDSELTSFDKNSGTMSAAWEEAGTHTGQLITITLKVKKATPGNTTIRLKEVKCNNSATNSAVSITESSVQIALACEHTYPKNPDGSFIYTQEGDKHKQTCEKCGTPKLEEHDWNDGVGKPDPTCTDPGTVEHTCIICHTTKTENVNALGHAWDNDCDTTCNRGCGETRVANHNYVLVNTDPEAHWYKCDCGELKPGSWEKHVPGAEPTATSAQVCTVCNYEIKPAIAHTHVMETEWTTDSTYHWHRCQGKNPSCYYVEDKAKHDYDNACDVNCNTCGYIREAPHNYKQEWQANATGHWNVCTACNASSQVFDHVPGPEATADTPQTCQECGFVLKRELSHVHNYADTWYSDDESHWQSCTECAETTTVEAHTWDQGTDLEDGKVRFTCTVCAKELVADAIEETLPTTVPTTPPATQKPTEPAKSDGFPWQWAGIAAIILLVIGVVLLVIEFIRSRKSNMHGRFSK